VSFRSGADFLEEVRNLIDIREIVSDYLPLNKSGGRYRGLCPFHSEKTPSFYVDTGKQLFYCFGCGTGGDAFKFLMLYEKIDFPEALRMLARRQGVPIPERSAASSSERQLLLGANRAALKYFRETLSKSAEGDRGREYLSCRGLRPETTEEFELGFAANRWEGLKSALLGSGFTEPQLISAGLLLRKEETGRTYDRFRDRLIFPIHDSSGDCIGFGGRIVGSGEPKYLNSPETRLFRKGETLYGLHRTGEAIRRAQSAVLVEGYVDFLSLYQAGFRNLAATLGTGFSEGHSRLLRRFVRRVVVNFDPDSAGQAATRRSLDILLESGFDVRVLRLPGGKDPDRFVREDGREAYGRLLDGAAPYIEYLAREAAEKVDLATTAGKIEALNLVLPYVGRLESAVERSEQVKLLSDLLRIEDGIILQELKVALAARKTNLKSGHPEETPGISSEPGARLIRVLMEEPEAREELVSRIQDEDLKGSEVEGIWLILKDLCRTGSQVSYPRLGWLLAEPREQNLLLRIASLPGPTPSLQEGEACLKKLRETRLARRMQDLQERLERAAPGAVVDELLKQKMDLRKEMQALRTPPAP